METDSPVVYHGTEPRRVRDPKDIKVSLNTELTAEEKAILRACNRESLYYRCIPFSMIGMAATQAAVRKGYLSSHPVWGSTFKLAGAAFVGWVLGKLSYAKQCEEKFLAVENSRIADILRMKRGYIVDKDLSEFPRKSEDEFAVKDDSYNTYSDDYHSSYGSLNLDVDKNVQYSGLDDRERPSTDREIMTVPEDVVPPKSFTTYEDLRQKNREEYEKSQRSYTRPDKTVPPLGQRPWSSIDNPPPSGQRPWSSPDNPPPRRYRTDPNEGTTNKYGDNWDNAKFL